MGNSNSNRPTSALDSIEHQEELLIKEMEKLQSEIVQLVKQNCKASLSDAERETLAQKRIVFRNHSFELEQLRIKWWQKQDAHRRNMMVDK